MTKTNVIRSSVALLVVALVSVLVGYRLGVAANPAPTVAPGHHVTFKTTSTEQFVIRWDVPGDSGDDKSDGGGDWEKSFVVDGAGAVQVMVTSIFSGDATVSCEIIVDGVTVAKESSTSADQSGTDCTAALS